MATNTYAMTGGGGGFQGAGPGQRTNPGNSAFAGDGMINRAQSDVASSAAPDMMETRSLIPATHCPLSTTNES